MDTSTCREPSVAEKTVCEPIAVPPMQSEQARDEICLSASEIRASNEICPPADEIHRGWVSFGSLNTNELNARVEPCGTYKWKIESGKLKMIFHEVFLFVLTPKAMCFCLWSGIFYLRLKNGPSGTPVPTVILLTTGG